MSIKHLIFLGFSTMLLSCQQKETPMETKASAKYIIEEKVSAYEISDGKIVTRVSVSLHNPDNDTLLGYRAAIYYENEAYIDTLKYALRKGDTVYGELIFSKLRYSPVLESKLESELVSY